MKEIVSLNDLIISLCTIDMLPIFCPLSDSDAYRHVDYDEVQGTQQSTLVSSIRVSGR